MPTRHRSAIGKLTWSSRILPPADLDDQILRDQRHIAGVNIFTQFTAGQPECRMPEADNIFLGQGGGSNSLTIDKCSVVAAEVDDFVVSAAGFPQFRVMPGDAQVGKDEVIVRRPHDTEQAARQWQHRGRAPVHTEPVIRAPPGPVRVQERGDRARAGVHRAGVHRTAVHRTAAVTRAMIVLTAVSAAAGPAAAWLVPARTSVRAGRPVAIRPVEQGAGGGGRGGYLGLRVHRAGGRLVPQDRAVVRIPEPDSAFGTDRDPVPTLGANKCPIRASGILRYPSVPFVPEDRRPPGHALVGHDDVGVRIPAQPVRSPGLQSVIGLPRAYHEHRATLRRAGTQR